MNSRIHSIPLDDERVCFDTLTGQLIVTNDVGLTMWCALEAGQSRDEIVADLGARFDAPHERIAADLEAFLAQLEETARVRAETPGPVLDPLPSREPRIACRARWRFPDREVILESESREVVDGVEQLLGHPLDHFAVDELPAEHDRVLRLWAEGGRYPISYGGKVLDTGIDSSDAVTRLTRVCASVAGSEDGWVASLHAAVVERGGRAIVLPAVSGAGKTTLVAWLVGGGRTRLVNDDQAILRAGDFLLPPASYPLSVKNGSVPLLESRWPDLARLPVKRDRRGREFRELVLPTESRSDALVSTAAVVVPNRTGSTSAEATLTEVSRASVFRSLLGSGLELVQGAGWAEVVALTNWLSGVSCLRLDYGDLGSAERALEGVWARDRVDRAPRSDESAGQVAGGSDRSGRFRQ